MEQIIKSFATLEELDRFVAGNVIPEDLIPVALERLVDLTLEVCLIIFVSFFFIPVVF